MLPGLVRIGNPGSVIIAQNEVGVNPLGQTNSASSGGLMSSERPSHHMSNRSGLRPLPPATSGKAFTNECSSTHEHRHSCNST
jgi:hypothetical protein